MNATLRGVKKSRVIWLNMALTMIAGLELMGSHLSLIVGPKWGAGIMMVGALVNIGLRFVTTQSLAEKGE